MGYGEQLAPDPECGPLRQWNHAGTGDPTGAPAIGTTVLFSPRNGLGALECYAERLGTKAALKVLSTPDALLTLVLGGDHRTDGINSIKTALENPILRPHVADVEAKRVVKRFGKRKADLKAAAQLIDDSTEMSPFEIGNWEEITRSTCSQIYPDTIQFQAGFELINLSDAAETTPAVDISNIFVV